MLGKTFKGMTDEMLRWQTEKLQELKVGEEGRVVHVRPELVVEVAFDGVQASPQYPRRDGAPLRTRQALPSRQAGQPRPTRSPRCGEIFHRSRESG